MPDLMPVIAESAHDPFLLALSLFLGTFVLEDAAIAAGGAAAGSGMGDVGLIFAALYAGIVTGDLGLYGLGALGNRYKRVEDWVRAKAGNRIGEVVSKNAIVLTLTVRTIPGLRMPTYIAFGLLRTPFLPFFLAVLGGALVWTGFLFAITAGLAQQFEMASDEDKIRLMIIFALGVLLAVVGVRYVLSRRRNV